MTALKKHIVYMFLCSYALCTLAGLSLAMGWTKVADPFAYSIFAVLLAQTTAIIVAPIKAPEYFSEPEAMLDLQNKYAEAVADLQAQLATSLKDRENMIAFIGTKIMPDDPKHPLYLWLQQEKQNEQKLIEGAKNDEKLGSK